MQVKLTPQEWHDDRAREAISEHNKLCDEVAGLEAEAERAKEQVLNTEDGTRAVQLIGIVRAMTLDAQSTEIALWTKFEGHVRPQLKSGWDGAMTAATASLQKAYDKRAKAVAKLGISPRSDGRYPDSTKSKAERDLEDEIRELKENRAGGGPPQHWVSQRLEALRERHSEMCLRWMQ